MQNQTKKMNQKTPKTNKKKTQQQNKQTKAKYSIGCFMNMENFNSVNYNWIL